MRGTRAPTIALRAACGVIALLVFAHLVTDQGLFDLLRESNVPTWFSQAQFLLAAGACAAAAGGGTRARAGWILLAGLMTLFSFDEVAMIHERLEDRESLERPVRMAEAILAAGVVGAVYATMRDRVSRRVLVLLGAAGLSLLLSQAASATVEIAEPSGIAYDALAILEEVFEMLTGTLVLVAGLTQSSKNA